MKQHKLSVGKRVTKPILFGTLLVGLATLFINSLRDPLLCMTSMSLLPPQEDIKCCRCLHRFFEDVVELRALEQARNDARRMEVLERRQKQKEELAEKKKQQTGSD